jgi:hypothetical protein
MEYMLRSLLFIALGLGFALGFALVVQRPDNSRAGEADVLRPRVPADQRQSARILSNPLSLTPELVEKGKAIYHGKGFCVACHGRDGKGFGDIPDLRGFLPRNFTDKAWQAARSDGELFWILKYGSPGTDMAPFIPLILTDEEAWQVLLYVRSFGTPP